MPLPKIETPTSEIAVPSTQEIIEIRPFLVKEEKILLMALQSGEAADIAKATKQIVNNCVITPGFDLNKLELYDLEYILLQLRICSIGEIAKIKFLARENTDCPECSKPRVVEINLKEAKIQSKEGHSKTIKLTDTIGVIMKYPNTKMLESLEGAKTSRNLDTLFKVIWDCVDCIFEDETISKASEVSFEKGIEFLESLRSEQFAKLEHFFVTMPKLSQKLDVKCEICSFHQTYDLEGLESFFG
jgi:hypothetical protein